MKPDVHLVLETTAAKLMFEMAPQMQPPFLQGTMTVLGLMMAMLREEWDRAAARRVEENGVLRDLFRRAAEVAGESDLAARLRDAGAGADTSLRIGDLDAENDRLRSLLIDLHAWVEEQTGEPARALEAEIWQELLASTERRRFSIAPF